MKDVGYCTICRKIKRVNIRPSQAVSRVPIGECDACLDARKK